MLGFYVQPTAKVIRRRGTGLKSTKPVFESMTLALQDDLYHYTTEASIAPEEMPQIAHRDVSSGASLFTGILLKTEIKMKRYS